MREQGDPQSFEMTLVQSKSKLQKEMDLSKDFDSSEQSATVEEQSLTQE